MGHSRVQGLVQPAVFSNLDFGTEAEDKGHLEIANREVELGLQRVQDQVHLRPTTAGAKTQSNNRKNNNNNIHGDDSGNDSKRQLQPRRQQR